MNTRSLNSDHVNVFFVFVSVTSSIPVTESDSQWLSSTKLYLVIGCIIALVIIAVIQAGCTIYKTVRGSSSSHKVCRVLIVFLKLFLVALSLKMVGDSVSGTTADFPCIYIYICIHSTDSSLGLVAFTS